MRLMTCLVLASCSSAPVAVNTRCVQGATQGCLCDSTRVGFATCDESGAFGACACLDAPAPVPILPPSPTGCPSGYARLAETCVDIDECALDLATCAGNARCVNVVGSYVCECLAGEQRADDGACVDLDECAAGLAVCPSHRVCVNASHGYRCDCEAGRVEVDGQCLLERDTLVQTFPAGRKLRGVATGITGAFDIFGASRIGFDFDVIEVPSGPSGGTVKLIGSAAKFPDITFRSVTGSATPIDGLETWVQTGGQKTLTLTFQEPDGGEHNFELDATPRDATGSVLVGGKKVIDVLRVAVSDIRYANALVPSSYPPCPRPARVISVEGVSSSVLQDVSSCFVPGVIPAPRLGSPADDVVLRESRDVVSYFNWAHNFVTGINDRRAVAFYTVNPGNTYTVDYAVFGAWPSSVSLFDPTQPYGQRFLLDMTIVCDSASVPP